MPTTSSYWLGVVAATAVTVFIVELLRRGILREKYAALWLFVSAGLLTFAVFPAILVWLAGLFGFGVPANLLFLMAAILLLLVSVQLSNEISRVEARTRRLAEELALLRHDVDRINPHDARRGAEPQDNGARGKRDPES